MKIDYPIFTPVDEREPTADDDDFEFEPEDDELSDFHTLKHNTKKFTLYMAS